MPLALIQAPNLYRTRWLTCSHISAYATEPAKRPANDSKGNL
jgi:hypothetical protein